MHPGRDALQGVGKEHARHQPVCVATFHYELDIRLNEGTSMHERTPQAPGRALQLRRVLSPALTSLSVRDVPLSTDATERLEKLSAEEKERFVEAAQPGVFQYNKTRNEVRCSRTAQTRDASVSAQQLGSNTARWRLCRWRSLSCCCGSQVTLTKGGHLLVSNADELMKVASEFKQSPDDEGLVEISVVPDKYIFHVEVSLVPRPIARDNRMVRTACA